MHRRAVLVSFVAWMVLGASIGLVGATRASAEDTKPVPAPVPTPTPEPSPPAPPAQPSPPPQPNPPPTERPAERGYLGFQPTPAAVVTAETRARLKIPAAAGVVATHVVVGGPANRAGLAEGDVLLKFAGNDMPPTKDVDPARRETLDAFSDAIAKIAATVKVGDDVELVVERDGKPTSLKATAIPVADLEKIRRGGAAEGGPPPTGTAPTADHGYVGFSPMPAVLLSEEERARWSVRATDGVIATRVTKGSPAEKAGLRNGDVLKRFAGQDVPSTTRLNPVFVEARREFRAAFATIVSKVKTGAEVEIVVERDGKPVTFKATAVDQATMQKISAAAGEDGEQPDDSPGPDNRPK